MHCPACTSDLPEDDLFCECCGQPLTVPAPPPASGVCLCGAGSGAIDDEGFCLQCGRRVRRAASQASDHIEVELSSSFAGVSDRGMKHERNEDRFGIFQSSGISTLVVCDGVSSTTTPEVASTAVAEGVLETLAATIRDGLIEDPATSMRKAFAAGAARLAATAGSEHLENPPSTTIVAALVTRAELTVAWVGDSRAYWISSAGARALTRDHSWINMATEDGTVSEEEAASSPQAHAITRWIGADASDEPETEILRMALSGPGTLLLCTDGLWNYLPADELARIAGDPGQEAVALARRLVELGNGRGGHDNITVAILRLDGDGDGASAEQLDETAG